jgi:Protein of unknown function (DUF3592)
VRKGVTLALAGVLATVVGLALAGVGTWFRMTTSQFMAEAERAEGLVVDVRVVEGIDRDQTWYPMVVFRAANGQRVQFEAPTGSGRDSYHRGDRVPVAYDPRKPQDARIVSFATYGLPLVFILVGGAAILVGGTLTTIGVRAYLIRRWLLRHGQRLQGQLVFAGFDTRTTINGRHPYIVRASYQDPRTGRSYNASSDRAWDDPRPGLVNGRAVVVYDPRNPKRCLVDLGAGRRAPVR